MSHPNSSAAYASNVDNAAAQRIKMKSFIEQNVGFTSNELGLMSDEFDRYQFARRLSEMRDKGTVFSPCSRACTISGLTAMAWEVTE